MSIERTYLCDGPDCLKGADTAADPPHLPTRFIETRSRNAKGKDYLNHFCSWDCLMKYAAAQPMHEHVGRPE